MESLSQAHGQRRGAPSGATKKILIRSGYAMLAVVAIIVVIGLLPQWHSVDSVGTVPEPTASGASDSKLVHQIVLHRHGAH